MKKTMTACIASLMVGAAAAQADQAKSAAPSWTDKVTLKGDMRYRVEHIDQEDKDDRHRHRIRARAGLEAEVNDEVEVGIRLSTSQDSDPISSNQTLGDGESRKDVYLDLAYIDWHPAAVEGFHAIGGKMEMPFVVIRDLIWDSDLNPEGLALKHTVGTDALDLLLNAGGFWVEERSSDDDTMLYGAQVAAKFKTGEKSHLLAGSSYYYYDNIEGFQVIDPTSSDAAAAKSFGNSAIEQTKLVDGVETTTGRLYANGFELWELFAELALDAGLPLSLYGDYVVNQDADEEDTGYMIGLKLGKTKDPGSFDFDYNYRDLEANAVVGAFTDSDSFGGGTDGRGHKFSLGYQIMKNLKGQISYFLQEIAVSKSAKDYDRLQVDFAAKF